jgi:hypothetical protein
MMDGENREDLCIELGIEPRYKQIEVKGDPEQWIKLHQKARRNLTREEMRALIAEQIVAAPHQSDRAIAKTTGASQPTVSKVRADLIAERKVDNVVRLRSDGRISGVKPSDKLYHTNSSGAPPEPETAKSKKSKDIEAPPAIVRNGRGYHHLSANIIHHFADDNTFHSLTEIRDTLDPDGSLQLNDKAVVGVIADLTTPKRYRVETAPAARGQKRYKFYRQGKTIGLNVLKTKFRPVIKALEEEAAFPISYQTTVRIRKAAGMLIQLLRDLEAE